MRYPWLDAVEKWLAPDFCRSHEINVVQNGNNSAICDPSSRVTIVTYPLVNAAGIRNQIEQQQFKVVIADGEHTLGRLRSSLSDLLHATSNA